MLPLRLVASGTEGEKDFCRSSPQPVALGAGSPGEVTHWALLMEVIEKQPAVFKKNGVKCSVLWFDGVVV